MLIIRVPLHHTQLATKKHIREREMGSEIVLVNGGDLEVEEMLRWVSSTSPSPSSSSLSSSSSSKQNQQPLLSLNHVSFVCKSVIRSVQFYQEVLGFVLIKRPSSFDFEGAWLFNHGIGIHLLEVEEVPEKKKGRINPKDNHISFQTSDMGLIMEKLEEMKIEYVTAVVKEGGVIVDQLFFHDPDGYMIEICNCQNLPVLPLSSCPLKKLPTPNTNKTASSSSSSSFYGKVGSKMHCSGEVEALMMEYLALDLIDISY